MRKNDRAGLRSHPIPKDGLGMGREKGLMMVRWYVQWVVSGSRRVHYQMRRG